MSSLFIQSNTKRIWKKKITRHDIHWSSESLWHPWSSDSFEEAEIYWVFTRNCYMVWILFEKPQSFCKPWEKALRTKCFKLWSSSRLQGSYTFSLYVNDMKSAVTDCDFRLYADNACLLFSNENISSIEKHLNVDFNCLCE